MFQTTKDDVIFSGHGTSWPEAGRVTRVPYGVQFIMFGPPGTRITDDLGQMLEAGLYISKLFIRSPKTGGKSPIVPSVFTAESGSIPNVSLKAPRNLDIGGAGIVPHIVGVEEETLPTCMTCGNAILL